MTTQELKQQTDKVLGNSIRCLLPSYWWKRLFHQVADRIDEAEQYASELVEESKMPVVESEDALKKLDVEEGSLASVATIKTMKFSECYVLSEEDNSLPTDEAFAKLTRVKAIDIDFSSPHIKSADVAAQLVAKSGRSLGFLFVGNGICAASFQSLDGGKVDTFLLMSEAGIYDLNEYLCRHEYYFFSNPEEVGAENMAILDNIFTIVDLNVDVYVKGNTWERLAKISEIGNSGSSDSNADKKDTLTFVAAFDTSLNDTTTTSEKSANKTNASLYYQSIQNGNKPKVALKFSFRDSSSDVPVEVVPSFVGMVSMYNGKYQSSYGANAMVFAKLDIGDRFAGLTFDLIMDPDIGSVLVPHIDASEINILHARVVDNAITSDGLSSLLLKQNQELYKYALSAPVAVYVSNTRQLISAKISQGSGFLAVYAGDYVFEFYEDGTIVDHPIQKDEVATVEYVNEEVAKKVDKVEGKQLSTEDFTTALKTKLEGLNAFDPTEINNKVDGLQTQLNTLVSGDASTAIESFNEIIAFLNGVTDSETLDGIIASIEQQIANKQDKIEDLETIRSGAALGATALQEHQDISHLATKEELTSLTNEIIANEEVHAGAYNEINERIEQLSENVSGVAATKEELNNAVETITNTIIENEEITATALNDLQSKIEDIYSKLNALGA